MRDRFRSPIPVCMRTFVLPALVSAALLCGVAAPMAHAQEETPPPTPTPQEPAPQETQGTGTLKVIVKDADTGRPVEGAVIRIDSLTVARSLDERTDIGGIAVFKDVPAGSFSVYFSSINYYNFKTKNRDDAIAENVVVEPNKVATLILEVKELIDVRIQQEKLLIIRPNEFAIQTRRDRRFIEEIPNNATEHQNLFEVLRSVPGIVPDSFNQFHPRGENSIAKAYYLDGILLPQLLAGSAGQFLLPNVISSVNTITGNFAPEFGGGSGAILDIRARSFAYNKPISEVEIGLGTFNTRYIEGFYSNSTALRVRRGRQGAGQRLRYMFALSGNYTSNGVEPSQSSQTKFNDQASDIFFGKMNLALAPGREVNAFLNFSSARTNISPRGGGSGVDFAPGSGFLGRRGGLPTQSDLGQRFRQKDNNNFTALQYRSIDSKGMLMSFVLGAGKTQQAYYDVGTTSPNFTFNNLPSDSSIEYIPNVEYEADQFFLQGDITPQPIGGVHALKYGFVFHAFDAADVVQLYPQSQAALNALARFDLNLVPVGRFINNNYVITQPSDAPALFADKSGYYGGIYAQDTVKLRNGLLFNLGLRLDTYKQSIDTSNNIRGNTQNLPSVNTTEFSPRISASYLFPTNSRRAKLFNQPTVVRVGFSRMMATPAMGQGNYLKFQPGSAFPRQDGSINGLINAGVVTPQIVEQFDLSFERQLSRDKIVRLSLFSKDMKRTLITQQLIEGLQAGTLAVLNGGNGSADGTELYFELRPPRDNDGKEIPGPYGYFSYSNISTAPEGRLSTTSLGTPFGLAFYDFDQENTLDIGASYRFANGGSAGLTLYFGSGLYSSAPRLLNSPVPVQGRESTTIVNASYTTGPRFLNKQLAASVEIQNLFDSTSRLSFRNSLGGTRFQQGRRLMLYATGSF